MLCDTCQRRTACLPLQVAQASPDVQTLLANLKQCELRVEGVQPMRWADKVAFRVRQAIARFKPPT